MVWEVRAAERLPLSGVTSSPSGLSVTAHPVSQPTAQSVFANGG